MQDTKEQIKHLLTIYVTNKLDKRISTEEVINEVLSLFEECLVESGLNSYVQLTSLIP